MSRLVGMSIRMRCRGVWMAQRDVLGQWRWPATSVLLKPIHRRSNRCRSWLELGTKRVHDRPICSVHRTSLSRWSKRSCGIDLRSCRTLCHISTEINEKVSVSFINKYQNSSSHLVCVPFILRFFQNRTQWEDFVTCLIGKNVQFQFFGWDSETDEFIVFGNLFFVGKVKVATETILNAIVRFSEFRLKFWIKNQFVKFSSKFDDYFYGISFSVPCRLPIRTILWLERLERRLERCPEQLVEQSGIQRLGGEMDQPSEHMQRCQWQTCQRSQPTISWWRLWMEKLKLNKKNWLKKCMNSNFFDSLNFEMELKLTIRFSFSNRNICQFLMLLLRTPNSVWC